MTYKGIHEILKKAFVIYVPLSLLTPLLMYQWRDNNRLILISRSIPPISSSGNSMSIRSNRRFSLF